MGGRRRFKDAKASGRLGLEGRPVGVARRCFKALPAARRQHGRPPSGIRGGLLAWPGGGLRLCRRQGANMDGRRAEFGAPCWRGPAVLQGFAGGKAPTWAAGSPQADGASQATGPPLSQGRPHCHSAHGKGPPGVPGGPALAHLLAYLHTCVPANLHTCVLSICILYPISRSSQSASHALPQPASSPQWLPHPRCRLSESQ